MRTGWLLAVLALAAACHPAPPRAPAPTPAQIHADTPVCVDASAVTTALDKTLADHHASESGLVIAIRATPAATGADVRLRILRPDGQVGLDRGYTLSTSDCASAVPLLAVALDRWLTAFPEWAIPPRPPPPPPARTLAAALESTASVNAPPVGVEGELGGFADWGGERDRFGVSAIARTGWPHHTGGGRIREIALLGGATWRHRLGSWETRVELRAGALRVNGLDFVRDHSDWLPWWEVAVFGGRRFGWGAAGLELAASALQDQAKTRDGLVSQDLPLVRVGLSVTFGVHGE